MIEDHINKFFLEIERLRKSIDKNTNVMQELIETRKAILEAADASAEVPTAARPVSKAEPDEKPAPRTPKLSSTSTRRSMRWPASTSPFGTR